MLLVLALVSVPASASAKPSGKPPRGQISVNFSAEAGGARGFYAVLPPRYYKRKMYRLLFVFPGTDTTGREMHDWMGTGWSKAVRGIEPLMPETIFIYPDPKWRWDGVLGWALGPHAAPYDGDHDIQFVSELLAYAKRKYSVDPKRVFATGHSWGGDMAAVVGCFLGDQFKAIAPVAANRPYWFKTPTDPVLCKGNPAVWTFYGRSDDWFGDLSPDGKYGIEQNDFWRARMKCQGAKKVSGETTRYQSCSADLRFTLYAAGQYSGGGKLRGHQPPDYFTSDVSKWFTAF